MEDNKDFKTPPRRGRMGGPRGMGMAPEKAKDFKGSISKLMSYIGRYKIGIFAVMLFAAVATVFNVIGPKILGKATTALSEGLMRKIAGTGGMDFNYIGKILIIVLCLYLVSVIFSFCQGWIMTGITQKVCYRLRKEISEKMQRWAEKACETAGVTTYARVDELLNEDGDIYCLEINTLPGMTGTSLLPQEAAAVGMSYDELTKKIIEISLEKYN